MVCPSYSLRNDRAPIIRPLHPHEGYLVAELVLLVLLSLTDAKHVGFVQRIYLVAVHLLAIHEL